MVDRADPLTHGEPARVTPPTSMSTQRSWKTAIILIVIAFLEMAWLGWCLTIPLPNYQAHEITRGFFLSRALPQVVPGTTFRQSFLGKGLSELSQVENLPQRIPIVLVAALIAGAAIGIGDTIIRLLRVRQGTRLAERVALAYGVGTAILGVLAMLAGRMGWLDPWFIRASLAALAILPVFRFVAQRFGRAAPAGPSIGAGPTVSAAWENESHEKRSSDRLAWLFVLLIAPFVLITLLGSMLPATDFDVLEYHLQGPKEYYQAGRIQFLPHNVYTNMPFDVEMLHLLGMAVMADWWWGALPGQLLVALFGPAAAVLIYATGARVSTRAGWLAALVYLSTPWIYRIGVIAYVEGPLLFYHAALVWAGLAGPPTGEKGAGRSWMLLGLLAGGAMGCKYTALISAVIPFGLLAAGDCWRRRTLRPLLAYALGWGIVMAPWLLRNVADTGDPVYPLGYRIFHGRNWDEARQVQWQNAHGPHPISWKELAVSIVDVAGRSDWQSPLYLALAPLSLLRPGSRRMSWFLWAYAAYIFATWWLLTHRLDRFWLPILPILAILAGLGADWIRHWGWMALLAVILAISLITNLAYESSALAGFNEWTGDIPLLRHDLPARLNRPLASLDQKLPRDSRVLLVGQAAVFHVSCPIVYNTVFNPETIEVLAKGKDLAGLRVALRERGLTHIYVDWKEIERHREPGGYGFTDFVTRGRFAGWVAAGLLDRPVAYGDQQELYRIR
jgi:hypothetical protein